MRASRAARGYLRGYTGTPRTSVSVSSSAAAVAFVVVGALASPI